MKKITLLIYFLASCFYLKACQCTWFFPENVDLMCNNAQTVFVGELISIQFVFDKIYGNDKEIIDTVDVNQKVIDTLMYNSTYNVYYQIAKFKVKKMHKGNLSSDSIITVKTGAGGGDCGVNFYSWHWTINPDSTWFKNPPDSKTVKKIKYIVFASPGSYEDEDSGKQPKKLTLYTTTCSGTQVADEQKTKLLEDYLKEK